VKWRTFAKGEFYDNEEDAVVYFSLGSGDTHLIGPFAACLLSLLSEVPLTESELVTKLVEVNPNLTPEKTRKSVNETLLDLSDCHLVEPTE